MKTVFYEKIGRRYKPVSEYDSTLLDSFPKGDHLVSVYPGGSSRRFKIDAALAPMIAAGRYAEDAISTAVVQASEMRPRKTPITERQRKAWEKLAKEFGEERYYIELPSAREVAEAGVKAMQEEANRLMQHEAVKQAYEHFMLVCKLCAEKDNE